MVSWSSEFKGGLELCLGSVGKDAMIDASGLAVEGSGDARDAFQVPDLLASRTASVTCAITAPLRRCSRLCSLHPSPHPPHARQKLPAPGVQLLLIHQNPSSKNPPAASCTPGVRLPLISHCNVSLR